MNVYLNIDPSWSYRFLNKHKKIIASYDFCIFTDRFITTAINHLASHVNYIHTHDHVAYHSANSQITQICEDYPTLAHLLPAAFHDFLHIHMNSLTAINGQVVNYQPIIDDSYTLTGVILDIRSDLKPILQ